MKVNVLDATNESILSTLETFRDMYRDDPQYAIECLDDVIAELRRGMGSVGETV